MLEAPLVVEGKRQRGQVERFAEAPTPRTPAADFAVPEGKGVKLGDIEFSPFSNWCQSRRANGTDLSCS